MYVLFDENHNMYYVTTTDTEYAVNKMNTDTKETKKIFTITGEMNTKKGLQSTGDEEHIQLQSYDGRYLYISQVVNVNRSVKDFKEKTVSYGAGKSMTTQINTNYIYVLETDGSCADILSFKVNSNQGSDRVPSRQIGILPINFLCGDSRYLLLSGSSVSIEGLELTHKEYLEKLNEILESKTLSASISIQASFDKGLLGTDTHTWLNLVN